MGVVYEGFDPIIGRTVAIKTMLPEGLSPQEFEEYKTRFQREATAAGKLAHPNIITVYDFGEDNGILYLAMEFLEGKSLEKIVQEQTVLPIETILPIYDQICSALDHAHRNKVVHRDVKPANIMILHNGLVKVTDFGIAKMMDMGMTQAGQILGTPNYMSPEQVKGRQIDGRSDIFSLGVILYELVTGEKPFGGQNITTVIYKIINENPIPPRELDASIHAGLSSVISKALAKNPDERYQTCKELAEDLRNYKNVGGAASAQSTVVLKVAPVQVMGGAEPVQALESQDSLSPSAPAPLDEAPIASSLDIPITPPPAPRKQSIPQFAWLLGALVVVILGVLTYIMLGPARHPNVSSPAANLAPVQNPQQSLAPATQPGTPATATTAPATAAQPPITNPAEVPPKGQEPRRTVAGKVGQMMVSANVQGAKISVDGVSEPGWLTPHTIKDLAAGEHNVVISAEGYESFQQSLTIEGGKTTNVVGNLSAPTAELDIVTVPPGVEVFIDGRSRGPSPVNAVLPLGNHTYAVRQPGVDLISKTYNLKSGIHMLTVTVGMAATTGIVEVRTIPSGASVQADGSPIGGPTPTNFRLSVGLHTLTVSLPGCQTTQRQITVGENSNPLVQVSLNCP